MSNTAGVNALRLHVAKILQNPVTLNQFTIFFLFHYPHGHMPQELGIITHYFMYICSSTARDVFLGILYGYKMVMQVIALILAFSTRKVKVKGLNDAKYIAAAIYVTSIVLAVIIVATYSLKDFVNAFPTLFCTGFIIGTTSILGLVFVPKVGRFMRQVTSLVSVYVLSLRYQQYHQLQIH